MHTANIHELFRGRIKKAIRSAMHFKKFWISLVVNETKYGYIGAVSFTIGYKSHDCVIMILKFIRHAVKENQLLQKDLSKTLKSKIYKHVTAIS